MSLPGQDPNSELATISMHLCKLTRFWWLVDFHLVVN